MEIKVVRLGAHMPLSTRRVITWLGRTTAAVTPIGRIDGLADGVVLVRIPFAGVGEASFELTPAEAKAVSEAIRHAAHGVEEWQELASGYNVVRVARDAAGAVVVTCRGRSRPMRLSKLRGHKWGDGSVHWYRHCAVCRQTPEAIWVAADDLREHGMRVGHVEVCPACVDKLANLPETIAEVAPIQRPAPPALV
jgi:hypothetical protein